MAGDPIRPTFACCGGRRSGRRGRGGSALRFGPGAGGRGREPGICPRLGLVVRGRLWGGGRTRRQTFSAGRMGAGLRPSSERTTYDRAGASSGDEGRCLRQLLSVGISRRSSRRTFCPNGHRRKEPRMKLSLQVLITVAALVAAV